MAGWKSHLFDIEVRQNETWDLHPGRNLQWRSLVCLPWHVFSFAGDKIYGKFIFIRKCCFFLVVSPKQVDYAVPCPENLRRAAGTLAVEATLLVWFGPAMSHGRQISDSPRKERSTPHDWTWQPLNSRTFWLFKYFLATLWLLYETLKWEQLGQAHKNTIRTQNLILLLWRALLQIQLLPNLWRSCTLHFTSTFGPLWSRNHCAGPRCKGCGTWYIWGLKVESSTDRWKCSRKWESCFS